MYSSDVDRFPLRPFAEEHEVDLGAVANDLPGVLPSLIGALVEKI
jgi:hypothetical protein